MDIITRMPLNNMDCPDCASALEASILRLPGVKTASVNFFSRTLVVTHEGVETDIRRLVRKKGHLPSKQNFWLDTQTVMTVIAALLLILHLSQPRLGTPVLVMAIAIGGFHPARAGIVNLVLNRSFDINFLMTIAVSGAILIGELGEAATVVFLFALSHSLEAYTLGKTRSSIHSLMKLAPSTAWLIRDGQQVLVPTGEVEPGQHIIVLPGERIPVDGEVIQGTSELDQAPVTGEAQPLLATAGQRVYAGTINGTGRLEIMVSNSAQDSTLARIVQLVESASTTKAPVQRFVDRFARWYTPAVLGLAVATMLLPPLLLGHGWQLWFYRALTLLVVSCPCALVISTPVSIVSALGNAARQGVLIKNGAALERTASVSTVALDKTGTLTTGRPQLAWIQSVGAISREQLLAMAGAVEQGSTHPLADTVREAAKALVLPEAQEHKTLPGYGASALISGRRVQIVNPAWLTRMSIDGEQPPWRGTLVAIVLDTELAGWMAFSDTPRTSAAAAIEALHSLKIRTIMLTGDNKHTAAEVAAATGLNDFHAHLLPEHKLAHIQELRQGGGVMMVGDGINDAPALAAADVGVAMGSIGSDTALETADIALMGDEISRLPYVIRLSRRALAVIRWNIWFAIGIKVLALLLILPGWLTLWMAIMADTGATLVVVLNSMRLLKTSSTI